MSAPAPPLSPAGPAPPATRPLRPKGRRLWRRLAIGAGALVLLVLVLGVCLALVGTTLTLTPNTAALGQTVQVTATHVPAHQPGSIQLHSSVRVFPFTADANGSVNAYITVPRDVALGDHTVDICWNATCHASATLHVVAGSGLAVPTPSVTAVPSVTPGVTPRPSSTPTSGSKPSPTPPVISVTNFEIKQRTGTETVGGLHFTPGSTVTVTFKQGSSAGKVVGTAVASSSGYWSVSFTVPADAVVGYALITACDSANGCYDATVRVIA
jgi:hypothetical protein